MIVNTYTMDWATFIKNLDLPDSKSEFRFSLPAADAQLTALQDSFKLNELPQALLDLYQQTNGIEEYRHDKKTGELIWSIEKVIETNSECRNNPHFKDLYMSFDQLLFVSDGGNGDLFGFITLNGNFDRDDIFAWNHETDSRVWVAPNLEKFVEWWLNGSIEM